MIHKISKEWGEVEEASRRLDGSESEDVQRMLSAVAGVRDALKQMCDVSVTRTTLKDAVKESLLTIIRENRDELFPELAEVRARLDAAPASGVEALDGADFAMPEGVRERLDSFEDRLSRLGDFGDDVGLLSTRVDTMQGDLKDLQEKDEELERGLEESETKLRKEIQEMVEVLSGKLSELHGMLSRIESTLPQRETISSLEAKLNQLEAKFNQLGVRVEAVQTGVDTVAKGVEHVDGVTPEIRSLAARFTEVRQALQKISAEANDGVRGVSDMRQSLGSQLEELQGVLEGGIERWESDQSATLERLSAIRDTLRDQLRDVSDQAERAQKSFVGKLMGKKKDADIKMTREAWDTMSTKIESIVTGLESILAKR